MQDDFERRTGRLPDAPPIRDDSVDPSLVNAMGGAALNMSPAPDAASGPAGVTDALGDLAIGAADALGGDQSPGSGTQQMPASKVDELTDEAIALAASANDSRVSFLTSDATALAPSSSDLRAAFANSSHPTVIAGTGVGMSLQDTMAQIAALQHAIQDQTQMINEFVKNNRDTMQMVQSELRGSNKGYDQNMTSALSQAESSLSASLSSLRQASSALDSVRNI